MIGQPERVTQDRVIALFRDELGYDYLGDWTDRGGNSNIEESYLTANLTKRGCSPAQIGVALHKCAARPITITAVSTPTIRPCTICCATACR